MAPNFSDVMQVAAQLGISHAQDVAGLAAGAFGGAVAGAGLGGALGSLSLNPVVAPIGAAVGAAGGGYLGALAGTLASMATNLKRMESMQQVQDIEHSAPSMGQGPSFSDVTEVANQLGLSFAQDVAGSVGGAIVGSGLGGAVGGLVTGPLLAPISIPAGAAVGGVLGELAGRLASMAMNLKRIEGTKQVRDIEHSMPSMGQGPEFFSQAAEVAMQLGLTTTQESAKMSVAAIQAAPAILSGAAALAQGTAALVSTSMQVANALGMTPTAETPSKGVTVGKKPAVPVK